MVACARKLFRYFEWVTRAIYCCFLLFRMKGFFNVLGNHALVCSALLQVGDQWIEIVCWMHTCVFVCVYEFLQTPCLFTHCTTFLLHQHTFLSPLGPFVVVFKLNAVCRTNASDVLHITLHYTHYVGQCVSQLLWSLEIIFHVFCFSCSPENCCLAKFLGYPMSFDEFGWICIHFVYMNKQSLCFIAL